MSDTPRTDEAYEAVCFFSTEDEATEALCAMRDKCRELERQLEKYKGLYFTMRELDSSAVEKAEKLERENAALREVLDDLCSTAEAAMKEANRDCAGWHIEEELKDAKALLRKEAQS